MRLGLVVLLLLAAVARAEDNPEFPQTGPRARAQSGGAGGGARQNAGNQNAGNQSAAIPSAPIPSAPIPSAAGPSAADPNAGAPSAVDPNAGAPSDADSNGVQYDTSGVGRDHQPEGRHGRVWNDPKPLSTTANPAAPTPQPPAPPQTPTMDRDGAVENFPAVVDTYVAKKSSDGWWRYVEKKGQKKPKTRRLARPKVDEDSITLQAGSRYSGLVTLDDEAGGRFTLEFVVDFSGDEWKVLSAQPPAAARVPRRR